MSRELGWKQFQSDDPDSPNPADSSPVPSPLGEDVRGSIPWSDLPVVTTPAAVAAAPPADDPKVTAGQSQLPAKGAEGSPRSLRLGELVWLCLAVVDVFLALDFLLRAVGARAAGFVGVVSRVGNVLAKPFVGVLSRPGVPKVDHTSFWAALVAIVVYTVAAWIVIRLLRLVAAPAPPRVPPS